MSTRTDYSAVLAQPDGPVDVVKFTPTFGPGLTRGPDIAGYPARILIVDDERHGRQLLEVMLTPDGFLFQTAASGEEALAIVAQQPPDLLLIDVMMPGMDGYQVVARIKADPSTKNIPVIMITALNDRNARMMGLRAGAEEFLTKPVERAELCVRVRNLLRLKNYGDYYDKYSQMLLEKNIELEAARSGAEQAVERLQEVDRIKKGFLATVSHELRTPLTSIRGTLGLLASGAVGGLSDEAAEIVAVAERNAIRLMALINDILDLDRLENGKVALQFAEVTVESILRRALESLATYGQAPGVTIEGAQVASMIWADADRIVQVLVNLLSNAVKFSPPGGVVTIGVGLREGWVEFRVTDRGRGVPAASRLAIFERFGQVELSDAREKGGTGLGLAICKSIIEQHGGTIGVESEEGVGSSFWFRVATSSRLFALQVQQPIVVCGDRRSVFENVIREAGYAVIAVSTDDAAWELLQRTNVAAVLMKTDSDLLARLRNDPALCAIPAVLFGNPAMLPSGALSQNVRVLPERIDSRQLLVTIRDSLEHGRGAPPRSDADSAMRP